MKSYEKRKYERPAMQVVKLQHQGIICTSPGQAGAQNYDWNDVSEE